MVCALFGSSAHRRYPPSDVCDPKHPSSSRREGDMAQGKVWLSVVLVALATVPHAATGQPGPLPATGPGISDVPQQSAVLASNDSSPQQRDEAARRLVARHTPDAIAALRAALSDLRSQEGQLAAARALA